MKKRWIAVIIGLLALFLAVGTGIGFFFLRGEKKEIGRAVLYQTEQDTHYVLMGGTVEKENDDSWNTCIVSVADQFDGPTSLSLNYTSDEDHLVILYMENGSVYGRWILGKGTHELELSQKVAYLYLAVRKEEESLLNLTAYGQKNIGSGKYQGKYLSVLGDSISAFSGYIPYGYFPGYSEDDGMRVSDMWWYEMARITGMNICTVNASGGSGVTDLNGHEVMGQFKANSDRSRHLDAPGHIPDVICILLGINDVFQNVGYDRLAEEYGEMIEIIRNEYPNAEIFLCTYFSLGGVYTAFMDELNATIREVANEKGVQVLDLHESGYFEEDVENYFIDYQKETGSGVHPNGVGQKLLGQWAAKRLNGGE